MSYLSKEEPVYCGGPMSGIAQFNFPAFDAACADLRSQGYEVISPAEMDTGPVRDAALASADGDHSDLPETVTWGDLLARDVKLIGDNVGGLVMLPDWNKSRGARLETFVAMLCDKPIVSYPSLEPISRLELNRAWTGEEHDRLDWFLQWMQGFATFISTAQQSGVDLPQVS